MALQYVVGLAADVNWIVIAGHVHRWGASAWLRDRWATSHDGP